MCMEKEIIKVNKELGGTLVRKNSLSWACDKIKSEKSIYRKNAYLIRAIVVDHPFSDMNKSTATIITIRNFMKKKISCNEESLLRGVRNIAKNNIIDINKIEKGLRKWCQKKK
jgi:prophage maintenance system killer protein